MPWLVALMVVGQAAGQALAGRTAAWPSAWVGTGYAAGAVALCGGVLLAGWAGYAVLAAGYGLLCNGFVVADARLQAVISGPARATVTSVAGLGMETFALLAVVAVGLGSQRWSLPVAFVVAAGPALLVAGLATGRWLPGVR